MVPTEVSAASNATSGTLATLSKVSDALAIMSADNVAPTALLQIEKLGTMFHLNGPLAKQTPDLLRRCQSDRLGRLAVYLGYRAGDASSTLAASAGGQAVAALLVLLRNLYSTSCGELLYNLSRELLPTESAIASPSQLQRVFQVVSSKMGAAAVGNMLANHITRIRQVYSISGMPYSAGLLENFSSETMVECLKLISTVLREEGVRARFSGAIGGGNLVTLVMALCPEDALVTVEGSTIYQGIRDNIILDIRGNKMMTAVKEHVLLGPGRSVWFSITKRDSTGTNPIDYKWSGWLSTRLNLYFFNRGYQCTLDAMKACCTVVLHYEEFIRITRDIHRRELCLLGTSEWLGARDAVREMFAVEPPTGFSTTAREAVIILALTVAVSLKCSQNCHERFSFCNINVGPLQSRDESTDIRSDDMPEQPPLTCSHDDLWTMLQNTLWTAIACLYVKTKPDTIVPEKLLQVSGIKSFSRVITYDDDEVTNVETGLRASREKRYTRLIRSYGSPLLDVIFGAEMYENHTYDNNHSCLGFGNSTSVLYPEALHSMTPTENFRMSYLLVDGNFILNNRYYDTLEGVLYHSSFPSQDTVRHDGLELSSEEGIKPSGMSQHTDLRLTAVEGAKAIILDSEIRHYNTSIYRSLDIILQSLFSLTQAQSCSHSRDAPLIHYMRHIPVIISVTDYNSLDSLSTWRQDYFSKWQETLEEEDQRNDFKSPSVNASQPGSRSRRRRRSCSSAKAAIDNAESSSKLEDLDTEAPELRAVSPYSQGNSESLEAQLDLEEYQLDWEAELEDEVNIIGHGGPATLYDPVIQLQRDRIPIEYDNESDNASKAPSINEESRSVQSHDGPLPEEVEETREQRRYIEIAMVRGNRQAQVLAASPSSIIMLDCCLQCAWVSAVLQGKKRIIVT
jgi:hypothetical protein